MKFIWIFAFVLGFLAFASASVASNMPKCRKGYVRVPIPGQRCNKKIPMPASGKCPPKAKVDLGYRANGPTTCVVYHDD